MATLSNDGIADVFEKMSRVLALKGKDRFRILAYEKAAQSIRDLDQDLSDISAAGRLDEISGIGKDLAAKIDEALRTGHIAKCEQECRSVPDSLLRLFEVRGLGPKTIALLHKDFQVNDLNDLHRVLDSGALVDTPGFGERKIASIRESLESCIASHQRMLLGLALPRAEELASDIRKLSDVSRAELAGSLRRGCETIGDVDLLVTSENSARALREISQLPSIDRVLALGPTRATLLIGEIQVDVRAVAPECFGAALQYFTGSKQHNTHLRLLARQHGLKVNEYGVFRGDKRLGGAEEEDVYRLLHLPFIPAELREDRGEIDAALKGTLPELIDFKSIRGDLHAHTDYSDGRNSIAEMIERGTNMGYEYLALTDHSPSERVARGLDTARLRKKVREMTKVCNQRHGARPEVLMGTECDILPDGYLDYPDDVLAGFDVVVAAVHGQFHQSSKDMTARLLKAIANPYVNVIAHPTTRLIGTREPISFDFERVVAAAKKAGVALEINGSPWRLDLNDTLARTAQEAGGVFAIGSDAHSVAQLSFTRFGVLQARRGWVRPTSVVNTWPLQKLQEWLKKRRPQTARRQFA